MTGTRLGAFLTLALLAGCVAPGDGDAPLGTMTMTFRGETHVAALEPGCSGVCLPRLGYHGEQRGAYLMANARNEAEREMLSLSVGFGGDYAQGTVPSGIVGLTELTDYNVLPERDFEGIGQLALFDLDLGALRPDLQPVSTEGTIVVDGTIDFAATICLQVRNDRNMMVDDPEDCDLARGRYVGPIQIAPQNRVAAGYP